MAEYCTIIRLPAQLTYVGLKRTLDEHYRNSHSIQCRGCQFDWQDVRWADLPELVTILSWSARLAELGKAVRWVFLDIRTPLPECAQLRFETEVALGREVFRRTLAKLDHLKEQAFKGKLFPGTRISSVRVQVDLLNHERPGHRSLFDAWISAELAPLECMDVLGYMARYKVFSRARECGITLEPEPENLARSLLSSSQDSPSLALRSIGTTAEANAIEENLEDEKVLFQILGDYMNLDVIRQGAFAQILVRELGRNAAEHSGGSAWICTRLVTSDHTKGKGTAHDPVLEPFRRTSEGFLEIIVSDSGVGLTHGLADVLATDERASVKSRYNTDGQRTMPLVTLIDYSFDRLSSTKRDIGQMIRLADDPAAVGAAVASGLYWIWNVVRSHRGVLSVRTGNCCSWYNFLDTPEASQWDEINRLPASDSIAGAYPGTLMRICLPLRTQKSLTSTNPPTSVNKYMPSHVATQGDGTVSAAQQDDDVNPSSIQSVWIGDVARKFRPAITARHFNQSSVDQNPLFPELIDGEMPILEQLKKEHLPLEDGDTLLLDLCGVRHFWAMRSVNVLVRFFLEMNYTATTGRSTVILFNVPAGSRDLFESAINDAESSCSHLMNFRRVALMLFDDDSLRFICGWRDAEEAFEELAWSEELDVNTMVHKHLATTDASRLTDLISDNAHMFRWQPRGMVRLRPWLIELRSVTWNRNVEWLEKLVDTPVSQGGVHQFREGTYYRLSSTGLLVKDFYHFAPLLANYEAKARIAWLLEQLAESVGRASQNQLTWIISVTRSTMSIMEQFEEDNPNWARSTNVQFVSASTTDELRDVGLERDIQGPAILITDVISTGQLCEQVANALPSAQWVGTIALLDTRDGLAEEDVQLLTTAFGTTIHSFGHLATGRVYALTKRTVEKLLPGDVGDDEDIVGIDRVHVCPQRRLSDHPGADSSIWRLLQHCPTALKVGHYDTGQYHHYTFYVSIKKLLSARYPGTHRTLLQEMVEQSLADFVKIGAHPDKTVILYPPSSSSDAVHIAKAIQTATGALYTHVLYRDVFGEQWRFSTLVDHGLDLSDRTVFVVDDGTNTGDTLVSLLSAASIGKPRSIRGYVALSRMPLYKSEFLRNTRSLGDTCSDVRTRLFTGLGIPVYTRRTCPVCRFQRRLEDVAHHRPLFTHFCQRLIERLSTRNFEQGADSYQFLYVCGSPMQTARLREALEYVGHSAAAEEDIRTAIGDLLAETDECQRILDLAFIVCLEPELLELSVFAPSLDDILSATCDAIERCSATALSSLAVLAFHLIAQLHGQQKDEVTDEFDDFWAAVFANTQLDGDIAGTILSLCLALTLAPEHGEQHVRVSVAKGLASSLPRCTQAYASAWPFSRIYAYETLRAFSANTYPETVTNESDPSDVYDLAVSLSRIFAGHAGNNHVGFIIEGMIKIVSLPPTDYREQIAGRLEQLIRDFDRLHTLQGTLLSLEADQIGQDYSFETTWGNQDIHSAMAKFCNCLVRLYESLATVSVDGARVSLNFLQDLGNLWAVLSPKVDQAFDDLFPTVSNLCTRMWEKFDSISGLSLSCAKGLDFRPDIKKTVGFVPTALLHRFLTVAIQNLGHRAFPEWSEETPIAGASAALTISHVHPDGGKPSVQVTIRDNGPRYRTSAPPQGSGCALKDTKTLVQVFGGSMSFHATSTYTDVSLTVRRKE